MATKRRRSEPTPAAQAAKAIRQELKTAFPHTSFSVRSSNFSMGDSVDIHWTDGPTTPEVDAITAKYQSGSFDGMIDLYEYTNRRDDIPQSKYVMTQRQPSREAYIAAVATVNKLRGWSMEVDPNWTCVTRETDLHTGNGWMSQEVNYIFHKTSLLCRECGTPRQFSDAYCAECGAKVAELTSY